MIPPGQGISGGGGPLWAQGGLGKLISGRCVWEQAGYGLSALGSFLPSPYSVSRGAEPCSCSQVGCQRETRPVMGGREQERHRYLLLFLCREQGLWGGCLGTPAPSCGPSAPVSVPTRWPSPTGSGNSTFSFRPFHPRSGSNCERRLLISGLLTFPCKSLQRF